MAVVQWQWFRAIVVAVAELNIHRSSIRRHRRRHRAKLNVTLKEELRAGGLVVHWDGKLMQDLSSKQQVERLPILVSGNGAVQLLGVPKLPNGTGSEIAKAVHNALEEWELTERVIGLSFDTTSSNTGPNKGACVLIEQHLAKDLLYFACRHHVMELLLGEAFRTVMGSTSSPIVALFKRFHGHWESLDRSQYESGDAHPDVAPLLTGVDTEWFEQAIAERKNLRDDYRELLELTLLFVGHVSPRGARFRAPGPMHHARWMSKAIYALKVWMFRQQFKLTAREESGLRSICIFVCWVYARSWTEAPSHRSCPPQRPRPRQGSAGLR